MKMQRSLQFFSAFWRDTEGVTAIEYALLAALIAMAILGGVMAVGDSVLTMWNRVATCVASPTSCT
ncbi:MAG: hypothetical protein H6R07_1358 [Proteobacteria bacterium]|nr:hypothetical protein [Pseudomonadota bacterium]